MDLCIYLKEQDIEPPESLVLLILIMITPAKIKGRMIYEVVYDITLLA